MFIPIISFSQTYNEVMSITDLDKFKKVMIENNYQFDTKDEDGSVIYGYMLSKDDKEGSKSLNWGSYNEDGSWTIQFNKKETIIYQYGDYDHITSSIKEECVYFGIVSHDEKDYVTYKCENSKFDGKIGFMITENVGFIRYFPNE